jgi:hypothetical protein
VAINNAGKVTVVWAAPTGTTSEIRRTVLQPGSTTWSPALLIGTVTNPRPKLTNVQNLTIVTDGQGRETLLAANKLWRQATSTQLPTFQFRTSARTRIAAGDTATRIVWPEKSDGRYRVLTRFADPGWRAERVLWTRLASTHQDCDRGIEVGVGMVPGGRSYVAVGIKRYLDPTNQICGGVNIADYLTVTQQDTVLNRWDLALYANGGPFQIVAGSQGPVTVEYMQQDETGWVGAPPGGGSWNMRFFTR